MNTGKKNTGKVNLNGANIKINKNSPRSGLLYISFNNHNHIIESITSNTTLEFYETSLYYERYKKLHLEKYRAGLLRFLRGLYRYFDYYFIRKFFLTSGSTIMLYGLRLTDDVDFRITIFNLRDMNRFKEEMTEKIRPMKLDVSYVTDRTSPIVEDPTKHFYIFGVKCQVVDHSLVYHYQHQIRQDRVKSKADVLIVSYLLRKENIPVFFKKEELTTTQKKKMVQIIKYYYKVLVTVEDIDAMIDRHPFSERLEEQLDKSRSNISSTNIHALRQEMKEHQKRAREYTAKRLVW